MRLLKDNLGFCWLWPIKENVEIVIKQLGIPTDYDNF